MKIRHVEVSPDGVIARLNNTYAEDVDLRYAHSRALVERITRRQLYALASRGMVRGWAYGDKLCYAILTVQPQHARRVLRLAPASDAGPRVSHRKQSIGAKRWVPRPDRAKTGQQSHERKVTMQNFPTVTEAVPGLKDAQGEPIVATRRVVGRSVTPWKAIICGEEML